MALASENWMDKRVIVTGGARIIDRALASKLTRRDCSQVMIPNNPAHREKSAIVTSSRHTGITEPA
jgi:NAD(P)-dependent dehydrogenase (short-subunit alcohol dehydrogenase family)